MYIIIIKEDGLYSVTAVCINELVIIIMTVLLHRVHSLQLATFSHFCSDTF